MLERDGVLKMGKKLIGRSRNLLREILYEIVENVQSFTKVSDELSRR